MKATDLMVGDWVQHGERVCKVVSVAGGGIYFEDLISEGVETFDRISPIPLTPEILEKNFPNPTDGLSWFPEEGGFNCHTYVPNCEINAFGLFKYVHELQHALRLCGIEKEIVL